ncbi:Asp23/Gls24 family envelope stress response protein, partial [Lentilactobacillus hilgardii]|uniref:Asp23/Gls24 family envelope stress response protein n=1 Tax=Lentilactobacillus hilgardii TaxID=1588 RepID=UPI00390C63EF
AEYDIDISKLYDQIKTKIVDQVKKMTDLNVIEVNVKVVDIKTKAEYEKDAVSLQDRVENVTDKTKKAVNNQKENDESAVRVK